MCTVFPSSLGPMPMRWFDGLRTNSISSFKKLTQSFCSRFITCSRIPQPLLSMSMREGESVKAYSERYREMFNEIDGDFDEVAVRTFKVGFPSEHGLRKSLTGKPVTNLRQLMDRVDKFENWCFKYWKKSRMNHSSNDQIKWLETLRSAIKTSNAITIRNMDILRGL